MKSATLPSFWETYGSLDDDLKDRARKAFRLWAENPFHPSLRKEKRWNSLDEDPRRKKRGSRMTVDRGERRVRTLLVMGEYTVTIEGGWVSLWRGSELEQTMPAREFPKKTVDRVEFVTQMIHGQERATETLIDELELRGYELHPIVSPNRESERL